MTSTASRGLFPLKTKCQTYSSLARLLIPSLRSTGFHLLEVQEATKETEAPDLILRNKENAVMIGYDRK